MFRNNNERNYVKPLIHMWQVDETKAIMAESYIPVDDIKVIDDEEEIDPSEALTKSVNLWDDNPDDYWHE